MSATTRNINMLATTRSINMLATNKTVNDVIHGYFSLSQLAVSIIDTPEFQRLRNLKQLGLTNYVYPGANHTRFEHSLGTYHLAKKQMCILQAKQPELNTTDKQIELVGIAGLCHDLGHGPFSHAFEHWLNRLYVQTGSTKTFRHEDMSVKIVKRILYNNRFYQQHVDDINQVITEDDIEFVCQLIQPSESSSHTFFHQIVCNKQSGIDVDKFDYLLRDSYYTKRSVSFDYNRLFNSARVIDNHICYSEKEAYIVYELFQNRYNMFRQVYLHPVTKAIELLIMDIFNCANDALNISHQVDDIAEYLNLDDHILSIIKYTQSVNNHDNDQLTTLLTRFHERNLYKLVSQKIYSYSEYETIKQQLAECKNRDNYILDVSKINYGMGNHNPVERVYFYAKDNTHTKFTLKKEAVSTLLPCNFNEYHIRLYSRQKDNLHVPKEYAEFFHSSSL